MVTLCDSYSEVKFDTLNEVKQYLLLRICQGCLDGDKEYGEEPVNQEDIEELLGTACGLQYWLED